MGGGTDLTKWDPESGDVPPEMNFGFGNVEWAPEGTAQYDTNMNIANWTKGIGAAGMLAAGGIAAGGAMAGAPASTAVPGFDWSSLAGNSLKSFSGQQNQQTVQPQYNTYMPDNSMKNYYDRLRQSNTQTYNRYY